MLTGTETTVQDRGVCRDVKLEMQGCMVVTSFLPLELGSADVILGCQWLDTMAETKNNWKLQIMKFQVNGER